MNESKFMTFLTEKYAPTYNKVNAKDEKKESTPKVKLQADGEYVLFGFQGNHDLNEYKNENLKKIDLVLEKLISLQK